MMHFPKGRLPFLNTILFVAVAGISLQSFASAPPAPDHGKAAGTGSASGSASGEHDEAAEAAKAPIGPKREYNPGSVEKFPSNFSGLDLMSGKTVTYVTKRGRATLVFFVASWCEPCQQLMPQIKNLAKKYQEIYTDVIYVFAHDTREDAAGFAKEHKLVGRMVLANHEILKAFKNPPLPTIYVGDRYNYMSNRALKMTSSDIAKMDDYLAKLTAF